MHLLSLTIVGTLLMPFVSWMGGGGHSGCRGGEDLKCYECGEPGHFAQECYLCIGSGGQHRSPNPHCHMSPSYGHGHRIYSPHGRKSPRHRSFSPSCGCSHSRSPPYHCSRHDSTYANAIKRGALDAVLCLLGGSLQFSI
ncbi:hypothetical protein SLEP1_g25362 [Rubroshorea leprosula]|uniref:CCHC-type domain-containing protein n=1 Tax=Rubroshorea leprosula TaxID=152421 RepID=A0AAV5JT66_9ROSI|nr:hypothetical protein SLEP1_g25362 [Rubroshorea leprosula]